jgi:DNA-binding NarL/FixJ family response regulator
MRSEMSTLIAAKPGRMRDCLHALLEVVSQVKVIGRADDAASALRLVAEHEPDLVLLDINLTEVQVYPVLEQIKATRSQTRCIVLADNVQQRQMAAAAGADAALIKGYRADKLVEVIEKLAFGQQGKE